MQAPKGENPNEWLVRKMLERKPFDTFTSKEKSSFPHAHRANEDFAMRDKDKAINFEPDWKRELIDPRMTWVELQKGERVQHVTCSTRPWNTVDEFNATRERYERWRNRRSRGGHDRQLKTLEDWDHWTQFKDGTQGIVDRALRVVIKAYANGQCALRWGLPGVNYREAAEKLKAAGFGWVREQTFKDALRGKLPAENTIPANSPGVRELVLTLVGLWPAFEWERLVLDPPPGYLQETPEERAQPAQNDEIAPAEGSVSVWEKIIVAPVAMRTHRATCNFHPCRKSLRRPRHPARFASGSNPSPSLRCSAPRRKAGRFFWRRSSLPCQPPPQEPRRDRNHNQPRRRAYPPN